MPSLLTLAAAMALALTPVLGLAMPTDSTWSPGDKTISCGGSQAACCTGSYTAEGVLVDNCITYTPDAGVCQVKSNIYCCYMCTEALGSCEMCSHYD